MKAPARLPVILAVLAVSGSANAEPEPKPQQKSSYSLPWGLRPATAGSVLRADTALAFQDKATTVATVFHGAVKVADDTAIFLRAPLVHDATEGASARSAIGNPLVGASYAPPLSRTVRLPTMVGVTLPVGMGGGTDGGKAPASYRISSSGTYARSAMDNALFAVNYTAIVLGAGVAFADKGFTVQAETTLLRLGRVRGESIEKDRGRTNLTLGVHAGYAFHPALTVSVEARYQRWISTPAALSADPSKRDALTAGIGARTKIAISKSAVMRPGVAYFHPLDDPMAKNGYRVVIVDIPVSF